MAKPLFIQLIGMQYHTLITIHCSNRSNPSIWIGWIGNGLIHSIVALVNFVLQFRGPGSLLTPWVVWNREIERTA
jgi:hypothetical protein